MRHPSFSLSLCLLAGLAGCIATGDRERADSAQALVVRQVQLMHQLASQRDSVSRVLGEADVFIGRIDSSISRVKGLPGASRAARGEEGPLAEQVRERKDMLRRVNALVARARETAREVAELKDQQKQLLTENGSLKD